MPHQVLLSLWIWYCNRRRSLANSLSRLAKARAFSEACRCDCAAASITSWNGSRGSPPSLPLLPTGATASDTNGATASGAASGWLFNQRSCLPAARRSSSSAIGLAGAAGSGVKETLADKGEGVSGATAGEGESPPVTEAIAAELVSTGVAGKSSSPRNDMANERHVCVPQEWQCSTLSDKC